MRFTANTEECKGICLPEGLKAGCCAMELRTWIVTSQDRSWWLQVHEGLADAAAALAVSSWQETEWHTALGALELCVALGVQGEKPLSAFHCSLVSPSHGAVWTHVSHLLQGSLLLGAAGQAGLLPQPRVCCRSYTLQRLLVSSILMIQPASHCRDACMAFSISRHQLEPR